MGEVKERPPWHVVVPGGGPQGLPAQQEVNWSGALAFYPVLKGEKTALEAYQPSAKLKLGSKEDLREAGVWLASGHSYPNDRRWQTPNTIKIQAINKATWQPAQGWK